MGSDVGRGGASMAWYGMGRLHGGHPHGQVHIAIRVAEASRVFPLTEQGASDGEKSSLRGDGGDGGVGQELNQGFYLRRGAGHRIRDRVAFTALTSNSSGWNRSVPSVRAKGPPAQLTLCSYSSWWGSKMTSRNSW